MRAHLQAMQGRRVRLLMEKPEIGRTEGFALTRLPGSAIPGSVVSARILGTEGDVLVAEAA